MGFGFRVLGFWFRVEEVTGRYVVVSLRLVDQGTISWGSAGLGLSV